MRSFADTREKVNSIVIGIAVFCNKPTNRLRTFARGHNPKTAGAAEERRTQRAGGCGTDDGVTAILDRKKHSIRRPEIQSRDKQGNPTTLESSYRIPHCDEVRDDRTSDSSVGHAHTGGFSEAHGMLCSNGRPTSMWLLRPAKGRVRQRDRWRRRKRRGCADSRGRLMGRSELPLPHQSSFP
jgi:hypothetical protein